MLPSLGVYTMAPGPLSSHANLNGPCHPLIPSPPLPSQNIQGPVYLYPLLPPPPKKLQKLFDMGEVCIPPGK